MVNMLNPLQQVNKNIEKKNNFIREKVVILNPLWSPLVSATIEQLDVDKM